MNSIFHLVRSGGPILVLAGFVLMVPRLWAQINQTWRDQFSFTTANNVGVETDFLFTVDTQIIVSKSVFRVGTTAMFDYTQTYLMTTDPTVLGFTRGNPEMVPGNLFPAETDPGSLGRLYPKHFEHDLFIKGCVEFSGLTSATLKTNSPAPGGINSLTIGPIGIGGSGSVVGDTTYNIHQTPTQTFLDWVTTAQRGGFFFNGASINFKGELRGTEDSGHAELYTQNTIWQSANNSVFPLYILSQGQDVLFDQDSVRHGVMLQCVPEPSTWAAGILIIGLVLTRKIVARRRAGLTG